jgi:hypothetical protein
MSADECAKVAAAISIPAYVMPFQHALHLTRPCCIKMLCKVCQILQAGTFGLLLVSHLMQAHTRCMCITHLPCNLVWCTYTTHPPCKLVWCLGSVVALVTLLVCHRQPCAINAVPDTAAVCHIMAQHLSRSVHYIHPPPCEECCSPHVIVHGTHDLAAILLMCSRRVRSPSR